MIALLGIQEWISLNVTPWLCETERSLGLFLVFYLVGRQRIAICSFPTRLNTFEHVTVRQGDCLTFCSAYTILPISSTEFNIQSSQSSSSVRCLCDGFSFISPIHLALSRFFSLHFIVVDLVVGTPNTTTTMGREPGRSSGLSLPLFWL